ncbi:hypothetical protein [Deinococcus petrolearius]|uniref:Uncharacterized protein n=1 Tax=Deinococcus petrolearius TaxID=1751295 RepID=A0ABW1DRG9_9DEIO
MPQAGPSPGQTWLSARLDDLYLLSFGPRLGRAVQDLIPALHPALAGNR